MIRRAPHPILSVFFLTSTLALLGCSGAFFEDILDLLDSGGDDVGGDDVGGMAGEHLYGGTPRSSRSLTTLERSGYTVGYDEDRRNPAWVAYALEGGARYESGERPSDFNVDPETAAQVRHGDYTRSGYDRGHMAPNYAIATRYGDAAQNETFLMSNIIPQTPALNRGPWRMLEEAIAGDGGYAETLEAVWILVGPIFSSRPQTLPNTEIAIPEACFQILLDEMDGKPRALAVIMPQDLPDGARWDDFLTSVDDIEARTGLDFFPDLSDALEARLEQEVLSAPW